MNARELMIGDLVRVAKPDRYHGAICRIVSLINHKDDECGYFKVFILTKGNLLHEVCNEDIEPIPLTKEILEKNGYGEDFDNYEYGDEIEIRLNLNEWEREMVTGYGWMIRYVHQFQHALLLCGLNNLADNFKI